MSPIFPKVVLADACIVFSCLCPMPICYLMGLFGIKYDALSIGFLFVLIFSTWLFRLSLDDKLNKVMFFIETGE